MNKLLRVINNWTIEITGEDDYFPNNLKVYNNDSIVYMNNLKGWDFPLLVPSTVRDWCENIGYKYILDTIGVYTISNTMSLHIVDITSDDITVAQKNDDGFTVYVRTYTLYTNNKGTYFNWGSSRIYLDEVLRVN